MLTHTHTHTQLNIYTDSNKTSIGVVSGLVVYLLNNKVQENYFPLAPGAIIFQSELMAIANAAKYLTKAKRL